MQRGRDVKRLARLTTMVTVSLLGAWLFLFAVFGVRRWVCGVPWTEQCFAEFGRQTEAAVLLLWVSDRETLVGAVLAVAAAGVGAYYLNRQIKQAENLEKERRLRSHRAARSLLPLALSEICDFVENHIGQWLLLLDAIRLREHAPLGTIHAVSLKFARVSPEALATFDAVISSADDDHAHHFEDLLSEVQVAVARSRAAAVNANDEQRCPGEVEISGQIIELAAVYAKASELFDYARRHGPLPNNLEPTRDQVRTALRSMGWWEPDGDAVWTRFEQRYPEVKVDPAR